jgi:hypothetical protein
MRRKIVWMKGDRFERSARFFVEAKAADIFPLLCPVLEYDWIPDWSCRMVWSKSGVAERDATFTTGMLPFGRELWTCVVYEPPRRIEYLFTRGAKAAVHLEISLSEEGPRTAVLWTMRFTAATPFWSRALRSKMTEESFAAMIKGREGQLAAYFAAR